MRGRDWQLGEGVCWWDGFGTWEFFALFNWWGQRMMESRIRRSLALLTGGGRMALARGGGEGRSSWLGHGLPLPHPCEPPAEDHRSSWLGHGFPPNRRAQSYSACLSEELNKTAKIANKVPTVWQR